MPSFDVASTRSVGQSDEQRRPPHGRPADPSLLAPEDAFYGRPPPRKGRPQSPLGLGSESAAARAVTEARRKREMEKRSGRMRKGQWKKLLWVKQAYPDNYTDEETFLHDLKRNPSFQQYEFWPLMADATVIVQHLCSVVIFICCFIGIIQERVSPVSVVGWGTFGTIIGWLLWDFWVGQEEDANGKAEVTTETESAAPSSRSTPSQHRRPSQLHADGDVSEHGSAARSGDSKCVLPPALPRNASSTGVPGSRAKAAHPGSSHEMDGASVMADASATSKFEAGLAAGDCALSAYGARFLDTERVPSLSRRNQQRLTTAKSAILIYCALLGLSPILKSLTRSTTSDSIWAMSAWLMCINIFFFDYGGAPGAKFPASLSTNAALMASTVLASRLPSTTHVFSLTLFSIEVFGLFPVFRRHLRHVSWQSHVLLTIFLVVAAGAGVGVTVSGGYKSAAAGVILGGILTFLSMGVCSWWLIGLQKYKNEIHGPWDPARPVIRRRWD